MDKSIILEQRAEFYNTAFPKYAKQMPMVATERWLSGTWIMGAFYKTSGYYGAYPHGYLKRVMSLFPDCKDILHLFSGSLDDGVKGDRLDITQDAEIQGDAHELSTLTDKKYDLILADPPYSVEDAEHYGTPMINRNKVVKECMKVLQPGGFLVWLDQVYPMYNKKECLLVGTIGVVRSTNHRVRMVFIYQKGEKL